MSTHASAKIAAALPKTIRPKRYRRKCTIGVIYKKRFLLPTATRHLAYTVLLTAGIELLRATLSKNVFFYCDGQNINHHIKYIMTI